MVAGNAAALVGIEPDGAGYVAHLVARCGRMPCTHMWVLWFPDQPAIAYGEAITVASNPTVPDLVETVPVDVTLTFGDALVWTHGSGLGGRLLAAGDNAGRRAGVARCRSCSCGFGTFAAAPSGRAWARPPTSASGRSASSG